MSNVGWIFDRDDVYLFVGERLWWNLVSCQWVLSPSPCCCHRSLSCTNASRRCNLCYRAIPYAWS